MPKTALPTAVLASLVGLSFLLVETAISPALACCHGGGAVATRRGGARPPVLPPTPPPVAIPVIAPPVVRLPPTPIPVAVPRGVDTAIQRAVDQAQQRPGAGAGAPPPAPESGTGTKTSEPTQAIITTYPDGGEKVVERLPDGGVKVTHTSPEGAERTVVHDPDQNERDRQAAVASAGNWDWAVWGAESTQSAVTVASWVVLGVAAVAVSVAATPAAAVAAVATLATVAKIKFVGEVAQIGGEAVSTGVEEGLPAAGRVVFIKSIPKLVVNAVMPGGAITPMGQALDEVIGDTLEDAGQKFLVSAGEAIASNPINRRLSGAADTVAAKRRQNEQKIRQQGTVTRFVK